MLNNAFSPTWSDTVLSLLTNEFDIWLTSPKDIQDQTLLSRYETLLSADEQERHKRFVFPRHQHAFLVTRALVRYTLAEYTGLSPDSLVFEANEYGRPELVGHDLPYKLRFNVSHTDDRIVLLVNREYDAGIDVEDSTRVKSPTQIAEHFFSEAEVKGLFALPEARQRERFFAYWTLKEAYIKARGMGLAIPLRHFSFLLDETPGSIGIAFADALDDVPSHWSFGLWQLTETIKLALAFQQPGMLSACLPIRVVTPGVEGEEVRQLQALALG
jgi:4'-phosphopantetheinyl transferase